MQEIEQRKLIKEYVSSGLTVDEAMEVVDRQCGIDAHWSATEGVRHIVKNEQSVARDFG